MENRDVCFLPDNKTGKSLGAQITWTESAMQMFIIDTATNTGWTGELSYSDLAKHCQALQLTENEHRKVCRNVLKNADPKYSYHLENETFVWKKNILQDMRVVFGKVPLKKVEFLEVVLDVMRTLISDREESISKLNEIQNQIQNLKLENSELLHTLDDFTKQQLLNEEILYGKFVALLNTKKMKLECVESLMFKNLCIDSEEIQPAQKSSYQSDSDTEVDESDDESLNISDNALSGPSGIQKICDITKEVFSDSDTDSSAPVPAKKLKLTPPTASSSIQLSKSNQTLKETDLSPVKLDFSTDKSQPDASRRRPNEKPSYDMDSQELLDMM